MRFSVVIPFRDREKWLPATLRSLEKQDFADYELLFVDNASKDTSRQLCEAFAERQAQRGISVRLLSAPHGGASAARNVGLEAARAPYVYFFDSDDEISPSFLSDVARLLEDKPLDLVCARTRMAFPSGRIVSRNMVRTNDPRDQILCAMLATQGMVMRREFLMEAGGWNEQLPKWNDWELGLRLLLQKPHMAWLKGSYHLIHQHTDSLTGVSLAETYDALRPALKAADDLCSDNPSLLRALACRKAQLAAELRLAGHTEAAATLLQEAKLACPSIGWLYRYRLMGGRSAWRIFRTFY